MLRPIRSIATLATASVSLALLLAGGPATTAQATSVKPVGPAMPESTGPATETDGPMQVTRVLVDRDPTAPIQPRVPEQKWRAAGPGSTVAQLGDRALKTDRIFVKFRDDLKVRVTGDASRPIRSDAPASTMVVNGPKGKQTVVIDPNTALAEATALLKNYGSRVEQAIEIDPAKLKALEARAEVIGRRKQPDLAGIVAVTIGNDVVRAAEAFNALDAVEFAEVELLARPAQGKTCNPVDQSLQKGSGVEGANVRTCNEGTDNATGNPVLCAPGPVFPIWDVIKWAPAPPTTGAGSFNYPAANGSTICNRANILGWWTPNNTPNLAPPAGGPDNCNNPYIADWTIDLVNKPIWDCTALGGCNNVPSCAVNSTACQYGCSDKSCADNVAQVLPSCADGSGRGWDALCATLANVVCAYVTNTPYGYGSFAVEPTPSQDNLSTYCYLYASVTAEPVTVPPTTYVFQTQGKNTSYDPCFVARGPANPTPALTNGVVVFTDLGSLADVSDRGIRPWGFLWEDPTSVYPLGFVQLRGASGIWNDTNCQLNPATGTGIGNKAVGGFISAVDPTLPNNAILATLDPALKSYPYQQSHDCFTSSYNGPGCYVAPCCVYVCNIDPLCCTVTWDSSCVDYARKAPAGYCTGGAIGANWNTTACGTPDFTFKPVDDLGAPHARNMQLYGTSRPVVLTSSQYVNLAKPTKGGLIDLAAINCQAQSADPDCGGGATPVALNSTYGFLNSQFSGGGLDLDGFEAWALELPDVTTSIARGSGVRVALIDNACNVDHEDLVGQVEVEPGQTVFTTPIGIIDPDHGAAVFGEILAADNGFGITGVAPEATGMFFPAVSINGKGRLPTAITNVGQLFREGDVLCMPVWLGAGQTMWNSPLYRNLLGVLESLGITPMIAAGNGGFEVNSGGEDTHSITVAACWPGRQVPLPLDDNLSVPAPAYPGDAYCRYKDSNYYSTDTNAIDVAGWGSGVCTLGLGSLFSVDGTANRSYQANFSGTSAGVGMITGFAVRLQAVAKKYFSAPVTVAGIRSAMRGNVWAQCSGVGTGTNSSLPMVVSQGDFIGSGAAQTNRIRGFPKALETLQSLMLNPFQGTSGPGYTGFPTTVSVISGRETGTTVRYATWFSDNQYLLVQAARRGRGSTGQGYGRPLPYAGSGLITDVQVQATLTDAQVTSLFNVTILAKGRVNIGYAGAPNTLAIGYIWNNRTKRWSYLDYSFIDAATDPAAQLYLQRDVIGRALAPADVVVSENGTNSIYVRLQSYGLGIIGPYQMQWNQIYVADPSVGSPGN